MEQAHNRKRTEKTKSRSSHAPPLLSGLVPLLRRGRCVESEQEAPVIQSPHCFSSFNRMNWRRMSGFYFTRPPRLSASRFPRRSSITPNPNLNKQQQQTPPSPSRPFRPSSPPSPICLLLLPRSVRRVMAAAMATQEERCPPGRGRGQSSGTQS